MITQWQWELCHHPDKMLSSYIVQEGFRIGLTGTTYILPMSDYLSKEVSLNRLWKYPHYTKDIHISPVGEFQKKTSCCISLSKHQVFLS